MEGALLTTEPPQMVMEQPAACAEGERARELFSHAVVSGAPEAGWSIHVRVEKKVGGGLTVTGEMYDSRALPVADRVFTSAATTCAPLARAIGVWSSLVLDQAKPRAPAPDAAKASAVVASKVTLTSADGTFPARPAHDQLDPAETRWPDPTPEEKPSPEQALFLHHPQEEARWVEIGASTFLMDGLGTGGILGASLLTNAELGGGFFLRPAVAFGNTYDGSVAGAGVLFGRVDGCARLPGFYREKRGIQLDLCAGSDIGMVTFRGSTLPLFDFGPVVGLRGELASDLSAEVRGLALLNVTRGAQAEGASLVAPRGEVGLTWRLR